jgi:hypothetical protein
MATPPTGTASAASPLHVPVGPRLLAVLEVAYRARRPVLLEGPTGIGKSELIRQLAGRLGIGSVVLDLSLLEPPDLVGLPVIEDGRTRYALPSILPVDGAGIMMLEELNRAERYIQQPALQLLSARRLHQYELPPGWVCFAAINPETADYQVTPLDRALRARFLNLPVRADRGSWLAWAGGNGVHPGVIALAQSHERVLDEVPPRTWTYVSDVLHRLEPRQLHDEVLLRDLLGGYLPAAWVELLLAGKGGWGGQLRLDVRTLLSDYAPGSPAAQEITGYRDRGQTDRLDELTTRLVPLLAGPEMGVLLSQGSFNAGAFEALLGDLPGDHRERLVEAIAKNPTAVGLLEFAPAAVLQNFAGSLAEKKIQAWQKEVVREYRLGLLVTGLCAHLERHGRSAELKRSNVVRVCLGQLLVQLPERWAMPLVETLVRLQITPVRPVDR